MDGWIGATDTGRSYEGFYQLFKDLSWDVFQEGPDHSLGLFRRWGATTLTNPVPTVYVKYNPRLGLTDYHRPFPRL